MGDDTACYSLTAVVTHEGNGWGSGHYYAHCRNRLTGTWFLFNDNRVSSIATDKIHNLQAYLLFYEQLGEEVEESSVPRPAASLETNKEEEKEQEEEVVGPRRSKRLRR